MRDLHAAGVMFSTPDGRVLFVERRRGEVDEAGKWAFPGGSIEPGETPKRAARREVQEEIGFAPKRLGRMIDRRNGFATYRVWVGQAFTPTLNYEHTRYRWAHPDEAPQPLHPGVKGTLDKLASPTRVSSRGLRIMQQGQERMAFDGAKAFTPIRPAAPSRIKYQQKLDAIIEEMALSVLYWVKAAYRANEPATVELAQDAASSVLQAAFDKLRNRWLKKFDDLAPKIADWFVAGSKARVDGTMQSDLRKGGFTVKFKMTKAMRDAYNAVIDENVGLIRSIAEQHLQGVQVELMQSVQNGRDLEHLTKAIEKRTGVTKRRAARIALDQNNKATAVMVRTRALELGVTKARWLHSAGGKTPRPEHVKFSGQTYDIAKGHDFNNGEGVVWPGTAINCRCVSVPIVPGFE